MVNNVYLTPITNSFKMLNKYMPVKDYAAIKKCSVQHVYDLIKRGELKSKKIGTYTLVKL